MTDELLSRVEKIIDTIGLGYPDGCTSLVWPKAWAEIMLKVENSTDTTKTVIVFQSCNPNGLTVVYKLDANSVLFYFITETNQKIPLKGEYIIQFIQKFKISLGSK